MLSAIALTLAGLATLVLGAEMLTRGAASLSARLGVPPVTIGLTVVAMGTSMPELAVGIDAALQGHGSLSVGNITGANTINILLILGCSALLQPVPLQMQTLRMDLPILILAAAAMLLLALDGSYSRWEGALLVAIGAAYTLLVVVAARRESLRIRAEFAREFALQPETRRKSRETVRAGLELLAGIVIIVVAAGWFVDGAVDLARIWGVSDAFIGLTVVAIGTCSPELVTTIVSTLRKQRDIAVGNLLGSCIYNIFVVLGLISLAPSGGIAVNEGLVAVDMPVLLLASLACIPVFLTGRGVSRVEGGLLVGAYALYLAYLIATRT